MWIDGKEWESGDATPRDHILFSCAAKAKAFEGSYEMVHTDYSHSLTLTFIASDPSFKLQRKGFVVSDGHNYAFHVRTIDDDPCVEEDHIDCCENTSRVLSETTLAVVPSFDGLLVSCNFPLSASNHRAINRTLSRCLGSNARHEQCHNLRKSAPTFCHHHSLDQKLYLKYVESKDRSLREYEWWPLM